MSNLLTFDFESEGQKERFVAWFLDGGGEDSLAQYTELREEEYMSFSLNEDKIKVCAD